MQDFNQNSIDMVLRTGFARFLVDYQIKTIFTKIFAKIIRKISIRKISL